MSVGEGVSRAMSPYDEREAAIAEFEHRRDRAKERAERIRDPDLRRFYESEVIRWSENLAKLKATP